VSFDLNITGEEEVNACPTLTLSSFGITALPGGKDRIAPPKKAPWGPQFPVRLQLPARCRCQYESAPLGRFLYEHTLHSAPSCHALACRRMMAYRVSCKTSGHPFCHPRGPGLQKAALDGLAGLQAEDKQTAFPGLQKQAGTEPPLPRQLGRGREAATDAVQEPAAKAPSPGQRRAQSDRWHAPATAWAHGCTQHCRD